MFDIGIGIAVSRETQKVLGHSQRDVEKEILSCERTEKELISKIQTAHKQHREVFYLFIIYGNIF